jgi:hypothetical protein
VVKWGTQSYARENKNKFCFRFLGISLENTRLVKIFMVKKT